MSVQRGRREILEGVVKSDKMDKTRVVEVERKYPHPRYKKIVISKKRFKVHDGENATRVGDRVRIMETRPLSKEKRWIIREIIERAKGRGE